MLIHLKTLILLKLLNRGFWLLNGGPSRNGGWSSYSLSLCFDCWKMGTIVSRVTRSLTDHCPIMITRFDATDSSSKSGTQEKVLHEVCSTLLLGPIQIFFWTMEDRSGWLISDDLEKIYMFSWYIFHVLRARTMWIDLDSVIEYPSLQVWTMRSQQLWMKVYSRSFNMYR